MSRSGLDLVLHQRLAVQRLSSSPLRDPADVVRLLTCVQAQDAPLSRFSLGLRTARGTDDAVRATLDDATVLRTHILRPTWHYVAAEDLRWIQALTSAKVESAMAARHRQLELTAATVDRALDVLASTLAGCVMTRAELRQCFGEAGLPSRGDQVGHLLMIAELRALVCSGPLRGVAHTYALVDDRVPPTPARDRPDAVRELTRRFFAGHGPAAVTDLTRWTTLTQAEIKPALAELGDELEARDLDGTTLWAARIPRARAHQRAFLLPVFDEAYLTYPRHNFPRVAGHELIDRGHSFAESGHGVVVCDHRDVGWWTRRQRRPDIATVTLGLASTIDDDQRRLVLDAARRFADFTGQDLELVLA